MWPETLIKDSKWGRPIFGIIVGNTKLQVFSFRITPCSVIFARESSFESIVVSGWFSRVTSV